METRFKVETHNPLHDSHMYGVGLNIRVESGRAKIASIQPGSSAALCKLLQLDDVIISVNNREVGGEYCEQVAEKYLNGRQATSLELQVKGLRELYGETMMKTITVCLVRGTPNFIALLRRKEELLQSNAYEAEHNESLSKRLAALSEVPADPFSKDAQIPYNGSADSRPMLIVHPKEQTALDPSTVEWDLAYLHKFVQESRAVGWTDETKTQLMLYEGAEFGFGIEKNDRWFGDPRVVELLLDLHARYPGRVNLGALEADNLPRQHRIEQASRMPANVGVGFANERSEIQVPPMSGDISREFQREGEIVWLEDRLNKIMGLLEGFLKVPLPDTPTEEERYQQEVRDHQARMRYLGEELEKARGYQSELYVHLARHQQHLGQPAPAPEPVAPTRDEVESHLREVQQSLDDLTQDRRGGIDFESSEATLTPHGKRQLQAVSQQLGNLTTSTVVEIHVHTFCNPPCPDGDAPCNLLLLSRRRCEALERALSEARGPADAARVLFRLRPQGCKDPAVGPKKLVRFMLRLDDMVTV